MLTNLEYFTLKNFQIASLWQRMANIQDEEVPGHSLLCQASQILLYSKIYNRDKLNEVLQDARLNSADIKSLEQ